MRFIDLQTQYQQQKAQIDKGIADVLTHGQFIMGPEVKQLEKDLAAFAGVEQAVTCANGTDAIQLALMALGMQPGDAVFVPTFTFTATAEPVAMLGAMPIFVDVDPNTFNMCTDSLKRAIAYVKEQTDLNPRAIIPVDLFGLAADYGTIQAIANDEGIAVIEDAAQSIGGASATGKCGGFGEIATTSFFPSKPLGAYGDGGALFTNSPDIADKLRSLRVHGMGENKYINIAVGINSRLDSIQAAILISKLNHLEAEIQMRQRVADRYTAALSGVVELQHIPNGEQSAWAQYSVLVKDGKRDAIIAQLNENAIPTMIYYPTPLHQSPAYRRFAEPHANPCPIAESLAQRIFSLPMNPYLTESEQDKVCETLIAAVRDNQ